MSEFLTVGKLKKILNEYPDDMPIIAHREGKGHDYGINVADVVEVYYAYFGNHPAMDMAYPQSDDNGNIVPVTFLRIAKI